MKKIGILFGMENTFPPALVEKINSMKVDGIEAEFVKIGGIRMDEPKKYAVIIDRISQDIQFYRAYLKNAALHGTIVVNNPFWWTADDKFFNYALAHKMGVAIPPTVILPHNKHPEGTADRSMRNLTFPPELAGVVRLCRLPGVPEALFRRRVEARLQDSYARGVLSSLQPDRRFVHDAAARC